MRESQDQSIFHLIGLSNRPAPTLPVAVQALITEHRIFSGGKRHYALVKDQLPAGHRWIEISGKMSALMEAYTACNEDLVVFVSGDPFFYGFGNTLQRLLPKAKLQSYPHFNAIQLLCHKTQTNYNTLTAVSVHGRDWSGLDQALIQDQPLIGVLTDAEKSPAAIAARMKQYHFGHYEMVVGENLEGTEERITHGSLAELAGQSFAPLNCVLLQRAAPRPRPFALADADFIPLPGRPNMMTKQAIRLNTLQACALDRARTFWDVGTCTGSVAIEAKRHFPALQITVFEKRPECTEIIQGNAERFSTPGIQAVIGDFFDLTLEDYPLPDVVFIGGHGNRLAEMIQRLYRLNPAAKLVTNAVQASTIAVFTETLQALPFTLDTTTLRVDHHNDITILVATPAVSAAAKPFAL